MANLIRKRSTYYDPPICLPVGFQKGKSTTVALNLLYIDGTSTLKTTRRCTPPF